MKRTLIAVSLISSGLRRPEIAALAAARPRMLREIDLFANPIGARMTAVQAPTLVISGEFDPLVPPALSRRVAEAIPGARYAVVRRAGHNPMDERPRAFERVLLEFLQETMLDKTNN